jgi:hypothetical protein
MPKAMMRIISRPPGDAPPEIRDKWIGLALPVVDHYSGPTGSVITRRLANNGGGFVVKWEDAMAILGQKHPDARAWWESHVPDSPVLVFRKSCAEIIPD